MLENCDGTSSSRNSENGCPRAPWERSGKWRTYRCRSTSIKSSVNWPHFNETAQRRRVRRRRATRRANDNCKIRSGRTIPHNAYAETKTRNAYKEARKGNQEQISWIPGFLINCLYQQFGGAASWLRSVGLVGL